MAEQERNIQNNPHGTTDAILSLYEKLTLSESDPQNIINAITNLNIDNNFIDQEKQISSKLSARIFLNGVANNLLLHTKTINTAENSGATLALADQITKLGLISYYIETKSKNKPPFTQDEPFVDWDLTIDQVEGLAASLSDELLDIATEIITKNDSSKVNQSNIHNIINAIAYLKVKMAIEKDSNHVDRSVKDQWDRLP